MEQFILLIIFGLISLVFNSFKKPKEQSPARKRPAEQPGRSIQEEGRSTVSERREIDLSKAKNLREAAEILLTKVQPVVEEKQEVVQKNIESLQEKEAQYRKEAEKVKEVVAEIKNNPAPTAFQFQKDDVVKGIIMAEVLGPPRAKRPYRRYRKVNQ